MHLAVTGANGHIGAALCRQLVADGHDVHAVVYRKNAAIQDLPVRQYPGSIQDGSFLRMVFSGMDGVYHLAAQISIGGVSKASLWRTNVEGTQRVLDACAASGVQRLVHFSSIHAFRAVPAGEVFDETAELGGDFPYEQSKAAAQKQVLEINERGRLETICLNPTAVLGPWDFKPSLQGQMILDLLSGKVPVLSPGGFNWVDNRDIALAAAAAMYRGRPGEAYILSGQYATLTALAALLGEISGRRMPRRTLPFWFLKSLTPFLSAWSIATGRRPVFTREALSHVKKGHQNVSHAKAARDLGYAPRPLKETLRDTCDWFLQHPPKGKL